MSAHLAHGHLIFRIKGTVHEWERIIECGGDVFGFTPAPEG